MRGRLRAFLIAGSMSMLVAIVAGASAAPPVDRIADRGERLRTSLRQLEQNGDFAATALAVGAVFDEVIASVGGRNTRERTLMRDAAFACRFVDLLAESDPEYRAELTGYLLKNLELARALVFVIPADERAPDHDASRKAALDLLDRLRRERGARSSAYPELTAAICVVHDQPQPMRVNENLAASPDAVRIFDYYAKFEDRMFFGVRNVPAELLVYVVDVAASIEDMVWALERYSGEGRVGDLFFDIEYDYDHLRKGTAKKSTAAGWSLPNVLRYGGVCADQAYFAVTVGKSTGIPAAYTVGASGETRHAWVGYLESDGRRAWWNSTSGRYEVYRGVAGLVIDPQNREQVDDSDLALLSDFGQEPELDRQFAAAVVDAVWRLRRTRAVEPAAAGEDAGGGKGAFVARHGSMSDQLELLELGLRECPSYARGWEAMARLSRDDEFTMADRKRWASLLHRLCGGRYPDFYVSILAPMVQGVDDVKAQNRLWNSAFDLFSDRPDLAARVRLEQARLWRAKGDDRKEGRCYEDVIARYVNAGPFVLEALKRADEILRDAGDGRRLVMLYERAWAQAERPDAKAENFLRNSNWYKIGLRYAKVLDEAGRADDAAAVQAALRGQVK